MKTKRAKIAFFLPSVEAGGAERLFIDLANWYATQGHDVTIVCVRAQGQYRDSIANTVRIVDLKGRRVLGALFKLRRFVFKERPDVLFSSMTHTNVAATLALRVISNAPCRLALHEVARLNILETVGGLQSTIIRWCIKNFYQKADAVIAIAGSIAQDLEDVDPRLKGKLHVFPAPIDLKRISKLGEAEPEHPWLTDEQGVTVLGVGRLVEVKDFDNLLRAIAIVRQTRDDVRLVVLGEGEQRPQLEQTVRDLGLGESVALPGFTTNPYSAFRAADLFVLSSKTEGFPVVIGEALAMGCNVVATDCSSGVGELLGAEEFGAIVQPENPEALAKAILQRLSNPLSHDELSEHGAEFDISIVAGKLLPVLLNDAL